MASDLSTYIGNQLCRWLAGQAMPAAPTGLWVALYNGDPKAGGTDVTNLVSGSVGRAQATFTAPANDGATNTMTSTADADFGLAENGTTVTHIAIFDDAVAGNMIGTKAVGTNVISAGTPVKIQAAHLTFLIGS